MNITDKSREWCKTIRTKPSPLSEAIPMVQRLCDENDNLRNRVREQAQQIAKLQAINNRLREALEFYAKLDWKENTEAWQLPAKEALSSTSVK